MRRIQLNTIPGYEDFRPYYWVEDTGKIWSDFKKDYLKQSKHYNSNKLRDEWLLGKLEKEPYYVMYVGLHKISTEQTVTLPVHRLVAMAFIPNPNKLSEVNHIDKNTSNNDYTNLEWIEKSDNIKLGLGKPIWRCDKTTHQRIERYLSIAEAERIYTNGQRSNIIAVCKGRRKSAYGFFWEYDN